MCSIRVSMLFLAIYCTDTPLLIVQVCVFNNKVLWEEYYFFIYLLCFTKCIQSEAHKKKNSLK